MLTQSQLSELDTKFQANFAKRLADLNKAVIPAALTDNNKYECPTTSLFGGQLQIITDDSAFSTSVPARVVVQLLETDRLRAQLSVVLSRDELLITLTKPAYFAELLTPVVDGIVDRWKEAIGDPARMRYGSHYISALDETTGSIFRQVSDDHVEIKFTADFAKTN